jgi:cell shape-determining protein MreC
VKLHVEERVRTHLRQRFKLHSRAQSYQPFPAQVIFGDLGVFRLPTTAPWRSVHASV